MSLVATLRKHRVAIGVSAAVNVSACLFGFDTGVAGGVVALNSFKSTFHLTTSKSAYADASSNVVTLLNAGAFFGALIPPLASHYIGRKQLLTLAGIIFLIGGVLQTAAQGPSLGMIYAGRVVAGLAVGLISNVAPVFAAECAPKELRGIMMSLFEMFLVSGGMLAYWTTYGCSKHLAPTSRQWRLPLSLQIILSALVLVSSLLVPESPRWLARQDRHQEAASTLAYLRDAPVDDPAIVDEMAEILAQIQEEVATTKGRTLRELFEARNIVRLLWALGVGLFAMWCGHNAILYYGPSVFAQIGYTGQNAALMASGIFTCIKFASTILFLLGGVHFFSRKALMAGGAFFMGAFLFGLGGLLASHPPTEAGNGTGTPSGRGMMALIYLFVVAYSLSLGPLQWVYIGEIFPTRIRDYGMAISAANIWLWNFVVSKITPTAILNIGWKTWMIFGTLNICGCIFFTMLPETKDLSLEQMDVLFGVVGEETRRHDIELNVQSKKDTSTNVLES
ncbi:sugar transporter [Ophiostoma piceae UAMH 11346]|uniref:Sugar transporter n=1 Tax=Ophiostoma piceae (strain UAMH 11346) TaxID=1262450 RepID=S3BQA3_OPHP1|nr:sugar transporter [Ophiostoma piceae UAMH 11346]